MDTPFFSVIIPTLNEEKFLPLLLDSLTKQSYKDFEVVVVDGQSKDKTIEVAQDFRKKLPGLRVMSSPRASLPLQRNIGAKETSSHWLIFFDADDVLLPYALERCKDFIVNHPKVKFFTSWFMPDSDLTNDATLILITNLFVEGSRIVKRQIAPGPFAAVRRDVFEASGGYDENRGYGEDQEFSMRLYERGVHLEMLRETIYKYSLRRFRKEGTLKLIQMYAKKSLITLITRRAPSQDEHYVMGGQIYKTSRKTKKSVLHRYEQKLRSFIQDMFGLNDKQ